MAFSPLKLFQSARDMFSPSSMAGTGGGEIDHHDSDDDEPNLQLHFEHSAMGSLLSTPKVEKPPPQEKQDSNGETGDDHRRLYAEREDELEEPERKQVQEQEIDEEVFVGQDEQAPYLGEEEVGDNDEEAEEGEEEGAQLLIDQEREAAVKSANLLNSARRAAPAIIISSNSHHTASSMSSPIPSSLLAPSTASQPKGKLKRPSMPAQNLNQVAKRRRKDVYDLSQSSPESKHREQTPPAKATKPSKAHKKPNNDNFTSISNPGTVPERQSARLRGKDADVDLSKIDFSKQPDRVKRRTSRKQDVEHKDNNEVAQPSPRSMPSGASRSSPAVSRSPVQTGTSASREPKAALVDHKAMEPSTRRTPLEPSIAQAGSRSPIEDHQSISLNRKDKYDANPVDLSPKELARRYSAIPSEPHSLSQPKVGNPRKPKSGRANPKMGVEVAVRVPATERLGTSRRQNLNEKYGSDEISRSDSEHHSDDEQQVSELQSEKSSKIDKRKSTGPKPTHRPTLAAGLTEPRETGTLDPRATRSRRQNSNLSYSTTAGGKVPDKPKDRQTLAVTSKGVHAQEVENCVDVYSFPDSENESNKTYPEHTNNDEDEVASIDGIAVEDGVLATNGVYGLERHKEHESEEEVPEESESEKGLSETDMRDDSIFVMDGQNVMSEEEVESIEPIEPLDLVKSFAKTTPVSRHCNTPEGQAVCEACLIIRRELRSDGETADVKAVIKNLYVQLDNFVSEGNSSSKVDLKRDAYATIFRSLSRVFIQLDTWVAGIPEDEPTYQSALRILIRFIDSIITLNDTLTAWKVGLKSKPNEPPFVRPVHNQLVASLRNIQRHYGATLADLKSRHRKSRRDREIEEQQQRRLEEELRQSERRVEYLARRRRWQNLHVHRSLCDPMAGPKLKEHLRFKDIPANEELDVDANGEPFERLAVFGEREVPVSRLKEGEKEWRDEEFVALVKGLERYSGPEVFERIFDRYCKRGGILRRYNVMEITAKAAWFKYQAIKTDLIDGNPTEDWVRAIPVLP